MRYECDLKDIEFVDCEEKDIEALLNLIYKIAEYEKMTDQVIATKESLYESIIVKDRARVILVKKENNIIGYMLYFFNYSTFIGDANLYLEYLFILEEYRHNGIGKRLFKLLANIAVENNCKRIDWVCLDWNKPSLDFYKSINAQALDFWVLHRLEGKDIITLANS